MFETFDLFVEDLRKQVTSLGLKELRTPEDVDRAIENSKGTLLIFVNSTCGCAGGIARPALEKALKEGAVPDNLATVFAGQDREATEQARSHFGNEPPSSPSFALMEDGKFVGIIHRKDIEGNDPEVVAEALKRFFEAHQRRN
ncbi:MAG: BrxA/BrxB family bacilliredoxin [Bacteroidetes bacterium]|nr:BrxA/BrxB family bacilliredoxin [Bacteroidota bacterium]